MKETSRLAKKIATAILTAHDINGGAECTRVQLMLLGDNGVEANMGGRNKRSIEMTIDEIIVDEWFGAGGLGDGK